MLFLAIDVGTSFIKGCVLDLDARRLAHIHRLPFPEPLPQQAPTHRDYDPYTVLQAVKTLLETLIVQAEPCAGLVMCSQMHGLVLCDEHGIPRSPLTIWQDERARQPHPRTGQSFFEVAAQRLGPDIIGALGNEFRPGLPLARLFTLAEQEALPAAVVPLSLPDFLLAQLCGVPPSTEVTNAMAHGALNLHTLDWHTEALTALGLHTLRWPSVVPQDTPIGFLPLRGQHIPCYPPVGDYQCALAGALIRPDDLSLNISTGSQVSALQPHFISGNFQTRPFFDEQFLATITHIPAGRALNALVRLLTELPEAQGLSVNDPWAYIEQAAAQTSHPQLRVNLAFFASACGDEGALTHIHEAELTVGHLFRAAFENMAENYWACAQRLPALDTRREIVFSGGLARRFGLLRDLIRDTFHLGYRLCPEPEDTLLGLLALALTFTQRAPSVQQAMHDLQAAYAPNEKSERNRYRSHF